MATILVTGGRGLIGSQLAVELRGRGHEVWTLDLKHGGHERHLRGDVGAHRQIAAAFDGRHFDHVYHLAAEYGRWNGEAHYENLWQTNIIGTKHVLELQREKGFRLIFFSSAEVYGDYDGLMSEDIMDRIAIKQTNDYAITKWAGELQCLNHTAMYGNEIVRVRPVGCYGPGEPFHPGRGVIPVFVHNALHGRPFTVHRGHKRIFDYVDDTCRTLANIADHFVPGEVYNIGGREDWVVSIEELAALVLELTGAAPDLATYHDQEAFTTRIKIVDFAKARRDLDHDPEIDLREGLARYIAWLRDHGDDG